ncbi:MAG: helix-turn-helix transcriptional regulator [Nanoarchaeota archaeon]
MPKQYSSRELEKIIVGFKLDTSLPDLEKKLSGRTAYGIALKIRKLSKENPHKWNPQKVADYSRDEIRKHKGDIKAQKKRYKARQRGEYVEYGASLKVETNRQLQALNPDWKQLIPYLRDFLVLYNGNKEQFAEELGIHPSVLSRYLAEKARPNEEILKKMLNIFRHTCREDARYLKKIIYCQNASA